MPKAKEAQGLIEAGWLPCIDHASIKWQPDKFGTLVPADDAGASAGEV